VSAAPAIRATSICPKLASRVTLVSVSATRVTYLGFATSASDRGDGRPEQRQGDEGEAPPLGREPWPAHVEAGKNEQDDADQGEGGGHDGRSAKKSEERWWSVLVWLGHCAVPEGMPVRYGLVDLGAALQM